MACPLNNSTNELETWFLSLWNHFIIPYLMGTIMAGIEVCTSLSDQGEIVPLTLCSLADLHC